MASPEQSYLEYDANRARRAVDKASPVVAVPWVRNFAVAAGKRQRVNWLNVTRSVQLVATGDVTIEVAPADAEPLTTAEFPVAAGVVFAEAVQLAGLWVNNYGEESVDVGIFAVLGPDPVAGWPVYSLANGFDGIDSAAALPAAVDLPSED